MDSDENTIRNKSAQAKFESRNDSHDESSHRANGEIQII